MIEWHEECRIRRTKAFTFPSMGAVLAKKKKPEGLYRNLISYGDPGFSKYMRRAFLASVGGPLAMVPDCDLIELEVNERRIDLQAHPSELKSRRASFDPPLPPDRGWGNLHARRVLHAHLRADLDFLVPHPRRKDATGAEP